MVGFPMCFKILVDVYFYRYPLNYISLFLKWVVFRIIQLYLRVQTLNLSCSLILDLFLVEQYRPATSTLIS